MKSRIDRELQTRLYGNRTRIRHNLVGQLALARSRLGSSDSGIKNLSAFTRIPSSVERCDDIDQEVVNDFKERYDEFIEDDSHSTALRSEGEVFQRVLDSTTFEFDRDGFNCDDFITPDIDRDLKEYYGCNYRIIQLKAFRNYHHPQPHTCGRLGDNARLWHVDSFVPSLIKYFVSLTPVSESNGAPLYVSRDETKRILSTYDRETYSQVNGPVPQECEINSITGPPGTTYFMNVCQILHRAINPEPGEHRDMLMFYVVPTRDERQSPLDFVDKRDNFLIGTRQLREA